MLIYGDTCPETDRQRQRTVLFYRCLSMSCGRCVCSVWLPRLQHGVQWHTGQCRDVSYQSDLTNKHESAVGQPAQLGHQQSNCGQCCDRIHGQERAHEDPQSTLQRVSSSFYSVSQLFALSNLCRHGTDAYTWMSFDETCSETVFMILSKSF